MEILDGFVRIVLCFPKDGMGLFIVKKTLNDRGGDIEVASSPELTEFSGWVPKEIAPVPVPKEPEA